MLHSAKDAINQSENQATLFVSCENTMRSQQPRRRLSPEPTTPAPYLGLPSIHNCEKLLLLKATKFMVVLCYSNPIRLRQVKTNSLIFLFYNLFNMSPI